MDTFPAKRTTTTPIAHQTPQNSPVRNASFAKMPTARCALSKKRSHKNSAVPVAHAKKTGACQVFFANNKAAQAPTAAKRGQEQEREKDVPCILSRKPTIVPNSKMPRRIQKFFLRSFSKIFLSSGMGHKTVCSSHCAQAGHVCRCCCRIFCVCGPSTWCCCKSFSSRYTPQDISSFTRTPPLPDIGSISAWCAQRSGAHSLGLGPIWGRFPYR